MYASASRDCHAFVNDIAGSDSATSIPTRWNSSAVWRRKRSYLERARASLSADEYVYILYSRVLHNAGSVGE